MSQYTNEDLQQDPLKLAKQAEQDLNSYQAKTGHSKAGHEGKGPSDSATESGVNQDVQGRFPGASVQYGSAAGGASDSKVIPPEEGGGINPATGGPTRAGDFEGVGGPEDKMKMAEMARPGDQDVQGNVRQGTETRRP